MQIKEKKDWCVCKTVVELTSFDRFVIAQAVAELTSPNRDEVEHVGIVVPSPLYDNICTLLVKLAGKELCKNAVSNVFALDEDDQKPQPEMPEQDPFRPQPPKAEPQLDKE